MTPGLLFPAGLAALAALLVPLAIHIARRSEQVPTDFAALRWLRQKPKPRSRLRFDEWLLLALRLALLVTVALWLAQPVLFGDASDAPYIAVVPGLAPSATVLKDRDVHWLAPGFPAIDKDANTAPAAADIPLASLVRQLDAELPNQRPLTIIVPQIITGADGQRLMLSRKINWHIVPGTMPTGQVVERPAPKLSFRTDPAHAAGLRYLRAAATTWWRADLDADLDGGSTNQPLPGTDRNLIWLADGSLPMAVRQWVERGGTALVAADTVAPDGVTPVPLWQDELGKPLVEAMPMGEGRLIRLRRRLTPAVMPQLLEADFPHRLRALFDPPAASANRVGAADYAPLVRAKRYIQPPQDIRPWLAILIAALLLAERWVATQRRRGIAP